MSGVVWWACLGLGCGPAASWRAAGPRGGPGRGRRNSTNGDLELCAHGTEKKRKKQDKLLSLSIHHPHGFSCKAVCGRMDRCIQQYLKQYVSTGPCNTRYGT